MQKFETGKEKDFERFNSWFDYCEEKQIPYIIVKNKTKYSSIEWDYISFNKQLREIFSINEEDYRKTIIEIFKNYCGSKSNYTISYTIFLFKNIPKENAEKFAEEIFDFLYKKLKNFSILV